MSLISGLLIHSCGYEYPFWTNDSSRIAIGYDRHKALELYNDRSVWDHTRPSNGRKLRSPYGLAPFPPIAGHLTITSEKNRLVTGNIFNLNGGGGQNWVIVGGQI